MSTPSPTVPENGQELFEAAFLQQNGALLLRLACRFQRQYPNTAEHGDHLCHLLACATLRQQSLEQNMLHLLATVELSDPILARVERFRAAAERSFYRALKELKELSQNEAKSQPQTAPAPVEQNYETNPIPLSFKEIRAKYPKMDRNAAAKMAAGLNASA